MIWGISMCKRSEAGSDPGQKNTGWELLRCLMCFLVICCHFLDAPEGNLLEKGATALRGYAVPTFMLLSFVLAQKTLVSQDRGKIAKRLGRLLLPLIGWAVIYWIVYSFADRLRGEEPPVGLRDLLFQMLTGHSGRLNSAMWYQAVLLWLTVLFVVVVRRCGKYYRKVLGLLALFGMFLQYSGINRCFECLPYELKYPLGRLAEMLPLAVIGFLLSDSSFFASVRANRRATIVGGGNTFSTLCEISDFYADSRLWVCGHRQNRGGCAACHRVLCTAAGAYRQASSSCR